jgi:signal transduction histidine kinase
MVAPDFKEQKLTEQIESIMQAMFQSTGTDVDVDFSRLNENLLLPKQKLTIYRIAQEQCTNITKHAEAKNVKITMTTNDVKFHMKIEDDGKGLQSTKKINGIGIQNINNRVIILNGSFNIYSEPGRGFTLEIEIPLGG